MFVLELLAIGEKLNIAADYNKSRCVEIKCIFHWIDPVHSEICFIFHGVFQIGFRRTSLGVLQE